MISGAVLAGGMGLRLGGGKPGRLLGGRPLAQWALDGVQRAAPMVIVAVALPWWSLVGLPGTP